MWTEEDNKLKATFEFQDFIQAFSFMTAAAIHIEKMNHHPEWSNVYNRLHVALTTHDAGNTITDKDRKLAEIMTNLYAKYRFD